MTLNQNERTTMLTDTAQAAPESPATTTAAPTADELIAGILSYKRAENAAAVARAALEASLVSMLGIREEGSKTHDVGAWKVTLTGKINRTLDADKWREIEATIPANLRPVKTKLVLDEAGVKWLASHDPATYALCAVAITAKPGKPGVEIKPAKEAA